MNEQVTINNPKDKQISFNYENYNELHSLNDYPYLKNKILNNNLLTISSHAEDEY